MIEYYEFDQNNRLSLHRSYDPSDVYYPTYYITNETVHIAGRKPDTVIKTHHVNGVIHSVNDQPTKTFNSGNIQRLGRLEYGNYWSRNGRIHRTCGPAISRVYVRYEEGDMLNPNMFEYDETREKFIEEYWYVNDNIVRSEKIEEIIQWHHLHPDWRHWTDGEKLIMRFALS